MVYISFFSYNINYMKKDLITRDDFILLDQFEESMRQQNKSWHTLKNYRSDIEHFCSWLRSHSSKKLGFTSPEDIQNYSQFLSGKMGLPAIPSFWQKLKMMVGELIFWRTSRQRPLQVRKEAMAVASRRRHLSSLKNFFEFHEQAQHKTGRGFKRNPVRPKLHAIGLKDKDVQHTKTLTQEHFEALLDCATKLEQRLALWILYDGALRLEELSRLKFEAFHFPSQTLRFIRKGGGWHTLKLQNFKKIETLLKAHQAKKNRAADQWVFCSRSGAPLTPRSHYNRLKKLFQKAGLPSGLTPHSFRKGRATQLYAETKDLLYVRDYLNHRDAKVTQTYIDTQYLYS